MLTEKQIEYLENNDPCKNCKQAKCNAPCAEKKTWWELLKDEETKYWNKRKEEN